MKFFIQLVVALICLAGTAVSVYFMLTNELNFHDEVFGKYFGILGIIGAVSFIILTQNDDNEETNPGKEKLKK